MRHGLDDLVEGRRLLRRRHRAGPGPRQLEDVAHDAVQPVALLEHRLQELPPLQGIVRRLLVEEAGHARLDRRKRRAKVVRHRREQRRSEPIGLGVQP